ncbi:DUF4031 domain-containing protein [Embleya sp. NPDC050154]|uniref:DUF4031 domain-containing protein n=1 Tax=Embleya sp. NPDC050154 TaxID=3363988 RepID=UPI0037B58E0F
MTVYVDETRDWTRLARMKGLRHTHWAHLTADTEPELHEFAARLGLKRAWFQNATNYRWHYDVVPSKRAQAIRLGAVEIDRRQLAQLMADRRAALDAADPNRAKDQGERLLDLVDQIGPETRARIAQRLDDRFHEITGTPRDPS